MLAASKLEIVSRPVWLFRKGRHDMKNACKTFATFTLTLGFVIACATHARAGIPDDRLISARAGGVNFVAGEVSVRRAGRDAWQPLSTADELKGGDAVRTGADGRVEILLNPGSYLRLGENSECELTDASLDHLRLKLARGNAIVEAAGFDDADFAIALDTPQTQIGIIRSGVYRINVASSNATELVVRKGRALVGRERATVKEGMAARVGADGAVEVAKSDKNGRDALDAWSKDRAEEIARVNRKLQVRQLNAQFASIGWNNPYFGSNFGGVWLWGGGCYTFMPFVAGWSSPYGFMYPAWMFWPLEALDACACQPRHFHWGNFRGFPNTPATPLARVTQDGSKPPKTSNTSSSDPVKVIPGGGGSSSLKPSTDFSRPVFNPVVNNPPASASPVSHTTPTSAAKGTSPRDN
jgi:hypothetical protein